MVQIHPLPTASSTAESSFVVKPLTQDTNTTESDDISSYSSATKQLVKKRKSLTVESNANVPKGLRRLVQSLSCVNLSVVMVLVALPAVAIFVTWAVGFGINSKQYIGIVRMGIYQSTVSQLTSGLEMVEQQVQAAATVLQSNAVNPLGPLASYDQLFIQWAYQSTIVPLNKVGITTIKLCYPNANFVGISATPQFHYTVHYDTTSDVSKVFATPIADLRHGILAPNSSFIVPYAIEVVTQSTIYKKANATSLSCVQHTDGMWIAAEYIVGPNALTSSYFVPICNFTSGQSIAFIAYDRVPSTIGETLKSMASQIPGTVVFVSETSRGANGQLVSTSTDSDVIMVNNNVATRYSAAEFSQEPVIQALGKLLAEQYGPKLENLALGNEENSLSLTFGSTQYVITVGLIQRNGLEWAVCVAVPLLYFTQGIMAVAIIAFVIIGVALVMSAVAIGIFVNLTLKPIRRMVSMFELVEGMKLDSIVQRYSKLSEIALMQAYFFRMVDRMKLYRSFLPQNLLEKLEGEPQEAQEASPTEKLVAGASFRVNNRHKRNEYSIDKDKQLEVGSHSSASHKPSTLLGALSLGMDRMNVTICLVSLRNVTSMLESSDERDVSTSQIVEVYGEILDDINRYVKVYRGQLASFSANSVLIFWNNQSVSKPQNKAITCAINIQESIGKINARKTLPFTVEYNLALVTGDAMVGNIGSQSQRQFTVTGETVHHAKQISMLCRLYGCRVLMDKTVRNAADADFNTRQLLDVSEWLTDKMIHQFHKDKSTKSSDPFTATEHVVRLAKLIASDAGVAELLKNSAVFELGSARKASDGEWMYEMTAEQNQNKWADWDTAMSSLVEQNQVAVAEALIRKHVAHNEADHAGHVTQVLIETLCGLPFESESEQLKSQQAMVQLEEDAPMVHPDFLKQGSSEPRRAETE